RRAGSALYTVSPTGGAPALRHRSARPRFRRRFRDSLPSAQHVAASRGARRAVLLRPRRSGGQYLEAAISDGFPLLARRRDLPALERLRRLLQPRSDTDPGRGDAGWSRLSLDRQDGGELARRL